MKIPKPIHPPLFPQDSFEQRKIAAEVFLKEMSEEVGDYTEPDPTFEEVRDRYRFSVSIVFWSSIIGSVSLLIGSIAYLLLPSPSAYITTQDGRLIDLPPIQVQAYEQ